MITLNTRLTPAAQRREWLKTTVVLGMAVYLAVLLLTGAINNYMNVRFQWLVLLATGLLLVLGLWHARQTMRQSTHAHDPLADIDHSHSTIGATTIGILAIPLLFALLIPSQPLGAEAITGGISFNPVGVGNAETFSRAPQDRNILDWLREFNRVGNAASFNDQPVDVVGFIYREPDMAPNEFMVARYTMSCCVADAFAIGIPMVSEQAATFETGEWVRVEGTLQAGTFNGETMPIIQPSLLERTDIPASPYLFP